MRLMPFKPDHKLVSIYFMVKTCSSFLFFFLPVCHQPGLFQGGESLWFGKVMEIKCRGVTDYTKVKCGCMANEVAMALMLLIQFHSARLSAL